MNNIFECAIKYSKTINGAEKKVTETYLVKADTVSEAEVRLIEKMTPYLHGDYKVTKCNQLDVMDIFLGDEVDASIYYKYKVAFITISESTGEEKKSTHLFIVYSNTVKNSLKLFEDSMRGSMLDWEIQSISATKIVEMFEEESK